MKEIDEISQKLGSFETHIKTTSDNVRKILKSQEKLTKDVILQGSDLDSAHKRIDSTKEDIKVLEDTVESHEAVKNKAVGIVSAAGVFGGALGYLGNIISRALF
jgi:chromosome segregation ATPase